GSEPTGLPPPIDGRRVRERDPLLRGRDRERDRLQPARLHRAMGRHALVVSVRSGGTQRTEQRAVRRGVRECLTVLRLWLLLRDGPSGAADQGLERSYVVG